MWVVPLLFGLLSLCLGQDTNWDLFNYHLYNPFALLNGKIGYDLAPARWQSYFNPTLDLLPYLLNQWLPAPLAGVVMGFLHGLNFPLLILVARRFVVRCENDTDTAARRRILLLSCAGSLGSGFLMEIGNSMGDNLTAIGVLGSLAMLLARPRASNGLRGEGFLWLAGLCCGAVVGLKLTNAPYALALCLSILLVDGAWLLRLRHAFMYGIGVMSGIGVTAAYWYWKMWQIFGNPLFPQFNDRFLGPLATPMGVGDAGWLPRNVWEKLLWPFIFTFDPKRVIEIHLRQIIWPVLYMVFIVLVVQALYSLWRGRVRIPLAIPQRFVLVFFALAYVIWLNVFGIYRYLTSLELLAPMVLWVLLQRLLPQRWSACVGASLILLQLMVIFPLGNWGHIAWARTAFRIEAPVIAAPRESIVFLVQQDPPMGWLAIGLPPTLAVVSVGTGFPESAAYRQRVVTMMDGRKGPFYVILAVQKTSDGISVRTEAQAALDKYGLLLGAGRLCIPFDAYSGRQHWTYVLCPLLRQGPARL